MRLRRLSWRADDGGFSLIESVVALTVASFVFAAFGASLLSSVRAVNVGRSVQQAGNVAEQAMEQLRSNGYDSLAMRASDLSVNDPLNLAACTCYNPVNNSTSGSQVEPLAPLDDAGLPVTHVTTQVINNTTYTKRVYITQPTDSTGATYKRLTIVVSWKVAATERTRIISSTISRSRSGLPLPDYKFTPRTATSDCVSPGATKIFGFTLTNNGARDSWTLSSAGGPVTWTYYADDGAWSFGNYGSDDTQLDSGVDGPVEPTESKTIWAVGTVPNGTSLGTSTITFSATSVAYPEYHQDVVATLQVATTCVGVPTPTPTGSPTPSATPTPTPTATPPVQPVTCVNSVPTANPSGSASAVTYYLANGSTNLDNTVASNPLPLQRLTVPTSTTLWNYSTDLLANVAGRAVNTSGSTVATTPEWRYQFANQTKLTGTGVVVLYGAPQSGLSSSALTFTVTIKRLSSAGTVQATISTQTYGSGSWGCAGFKPFGVSIPFGTGSGTSINPNDFLSITVTASTPALLAYDTTAFPAQLVLPVKSGGS